MSTDPKTSAAGGLDIVRTQIAKAALRAGRSANDITLVAVSKTFPVEHIRPVLEAGQRVFGENRVQDAQQKWPTLRNDCPDAHVHLIGPLQSNKAKDAVALFDAIHSVDRPKIARVLAEEMDRQDRRPDVFLQINTGEEPQKAGMLPADADDFIQSCVEEHGLPVRGLMCIPPADENPALHFALLAKIAARNGLNGLSMGMSGDFETAIEQGATHVRVGSAIFGSRG
ncbi:YggS family pyridoxal phosphate-dependent enzyme [Pyruvatibacter mobilis]|uniref:Pyridoxal phosphate homeostasis protein n=1 Tax=Pyruvatibacter mobilis TaxID=1712261 RepID=A0A845QAR6_9HYPH|nr:YggS family pyridoxal phosphate-dependent enzyme [Pyruvatibacter mobilis]NBG95161.1 YggS family pyridoxal phosphate-dependent enzyme [Pyruvatibacter mobilis]QJD76343.1 YggS family pyridoxal phosphate-dependent enzyme [Pyruvatibacter mobilis]GGD23302.1 YggS family pyridoxal phosphate enzyme [Pyruvatibacter mobilis]